MFYILLFDHLIEINWQLSSVRMEMKFVSINGLAYPPENSPPRDTENSFLFRIH